MEYGRIPADQFDAFDSTLPPDAIDNDKIFPGLQCTQWLF